MIRKKDLIEIIATDNEITKTKAKEFIESFLSAIQTALVHGEEVELNGLGKFKVNERKERTGINPLTKEKITIAAAKTVTFKPSNSIKEKLNG